MDEEQEPRAQLKFRVSRELRNRLEAAASEKGHSLSQEIVNRLRSWEREVDSLLDAELSDGAPDAIIETVGRAMQDIGAVIGSLDPVGRERGWLHSPYAFDQAVRGACEVLEAFRPDGEMPDFSRVLWMERAGQDRARSLLRNIVEGGGIWEQRVREKLGEDLLKRAASRLAHSAAHSGEDK